MSVDNRVVINHLKENAGVYSATKGSATRAVFNDGKKPSVLTDVKNTVYLKQNVQQPESLKKQLDANEVLKNSNPLQTVIKIDDPNEIEIDNIDPDCVHCQHEEDLLDHCWWPKQYLLTDDIIDTLCLDPNPKSQKAPSYDIDDWSKDNYQPVSPPCGLSDLNLPRETFADDLNFDDFSKYYEVEPVILSFDDGENDDQ